MNLENIVGVLLSAASVLKEPIKDVVGTGIKDAYDATKAYIVKKLSDKPEAVEALDAAIEKPDSKGRKAVFLEEGASAGLEDDLKLARLINGLSKLLPASAVQINQTATVSGKNNRVQQAARDIINTEKITRKNEINPGPEHIDGKQKKKLRDVITEVAKRLAGEDGKPKYWKVYEMLEAKFNVSSYLLIKNEQFEDALSYLKQQRAINRSRLRRSDPKAYSEDFFTKIHTCRTALGWERPQLFEYARELLSLKKPITSTKQLGPNQLKQLSESISREAAKGAR